MQARSKEEPLAVLVRLAELACKLLPMPGLRHVLDSRLAGVTDQNEGQSVLVRVAKLINAGTFARFGGRG